MMTGKRQSDDNIADVGRSEPNLGQKEAALEKASKAQLRHTARHHGHAPGSGHADPLAFLKA
jgi:hypothetical protein